MQKKGAALLKPVVPRQNNMGDAPTGFRQRAQGLIQGAPQSVFADWGGAQQFLEAYAADLTLTGQSLFQQLGPVTDLRKPVKIDVDDSDGLFCWFFHYHDAAAHAQKQGGHFHLFADGRFFGDSKPSADKTHLIAVELDQTGDLAGFFVPNRWTTNERVRPATVLAPALDDFYASENSPDTLLSLWLSALLLVFKEDILELLFQRDQYLNAMPLAERERYLNDASVARICEWRFDDNPTQA